MYEDSWYSYVPETPARKDDVASKNAKHNRRESLLKQANGTAQASEQVGPILELFEELPASNGPPEATLARRAKSYSDFYHVARGYLDRDVAKKGDPKDLLVIGQSRSAHLNFKSRYDDFEDELLDASQEEYQLYRDQLALSEQHLENLLDDTTSALDLLASLSNSFKAVESQTTAFQSQCEDLLAEQKRLRTLADEVGIDLQYYGYLEPLTRRLNAPGSGRLIRQDDFVEMLTNLNACIDFMDQHPDFRDSTTYKTRYISLLDRALNLVYVAVSKALNDLSEAAAKQISTTTTTETTEYALLYGSYENVIKDLGDQVDSMLTTSEFVFGEETGPTTKPYQQSYHHLFERILDDWIKSRLVVGTVVQKNLQKFAKNQPKQKPEAAQADLDSDYQSFARRCVQYVFEICDNERKLLDRIFLDGPLLSQPNSQGSRDLHVQYAEKLERSCMTHITTLFNFLKPNLSNGTLHQLRDLVNWVETMYVVDVNDDIEQGSRYTLKVASEDYLHELAQFFLEEHLWDLQDSLFLKAAADLQQFKPSPADLKVTGVAPSPGLADKIADQQTLAGLGLTKAFPTVKVAVNLLVMYNDNKFEQPLKRREKIGNVLYEIVHQTTESLQRAATTIKRESNIMDAQIFLIKNLILIENLFLTHEIPDSVRHGAEFDFSPIWNTIRELQDRRQLLNPLAYFTPLLQGKLLPAVKDQLLDARKELERVLVQQITAFTKYWQSRLKDKGSKKGGQNAMKELDALLEKSFDDETTRNALLKMIHSEET